jgi:hypothetical protein
MNRLSRQRNAARPPSNGRRGDVNGVASTRMPYSGAPMSAVLEDDNFVDAPDSDEEDIEERDSDTSSSRDLHVLTIATCLLSLA